MNAVIKYEDQSLALNEIMSLGDVFKNSGYFRDVRDQSQAVVKILYGRELGFSPVVSMMGIHIIEGKPALSSNLMGAMVKRSGKYDYRVTTLTDTACTLQFFQDGQPAGESCFTIQDANKAGVVRQGSSWTKYPRNMLFARALSNGVKLYCPELSACPIYVPEELGAEVNEEGTPVNAHAAVTDTGNVVKRSFKKKHESSEIGGPGTSAGAGVTEEISSLSSNGQPAQTAEPQPADVVPETVEAVEYISVNQQKNFHLECRKAVREHRKMDADILTYQWLTDNKYVNEKGEPTAARIKASGWLAERNKAVAWLKVQ